MKLVFKDLPMKKKQPRGVSTILILGVIAVLVTIVVPLVSRTVVDVRITKQQEEQARAFSVAETGLEKRLVGGPLTGTVGDISYQITEIGQGGGGTRDYVYPKPVGRDTPITIWLIEHQGAIFDPSAPFGGTSYGAGNIDIYWGEPGTPSNDDILTPAIEVTVYYTDATPGLKIAREARDIHAASRGNGFATSVQDAGYTMGGVDFQFRAKLTGFMPCTGANRTCYGMRIRLLYGGGVDHPVGVHGAQDIPPQGSCKISTATVQVSGVTSRLEHCTFYKDFPAFLDFIIYTRSTLTK
jgi:hypothetical protein